MKWLWSISGFDIK